jgi:hypothetical protein
VIRQATCTPPCTGTRLALTRHSEHDSSALTLHLDRASAGVQVPRRGLHHPCTAALKSRRRGEPNVCASVLRTLVHALLRRTETADRGWRA